MHISQEVSYCEKQVFFLGYKIKDDVLMVSYQARDMCMLILSVREYSGIFTHCGRWLEDQLVPCILAFTEPESRRRKSAESPT